MTGMLDVFLDEDAIVGEGGARLVARRGEALDHLGIVVREAHALAAAAGGSLDHHRIADLMGDSDGLARVVN